jgi:hypothetical protein
MLEDKDTHSPEILTNTNLQLRSLFMRAEEGERKAVLVPAAIVTLRLLSLARQPIRNVQQGGAVSILKNCYNYSCRDPPAAPVS